MATTVVGKDYTLKDVALELKKSNNLLTELNTELKEELALTLYSVFGKPQESEAAAADKPTLSLGKQKEVPTKRRTLGGDVANYGKGIVSAFADTFNYITGLKPEQTEDEKESVQHQDKARERFVRVTEKEKIQPKIAEEESSKIIVSKLDENGNRQFKELRSLSDTFTKVFGEIVLLRKITEGRLKYVPKSTSKSEYRDAAGKFVKAGTERLVPPAQTPRALLEPTTSDVDKEQTQAYRIQKELDIQAQSEALADLMPVGGGLGIPGVMTRGPIAGGTGRGGVGGAAGSRTRQILGTAGKYARGAGLVAGGAALYEGVTGWREVNERLAAGEITPKEAQVEKGKVVGSSAGGLGGAMAGAATGAALGSVVPVVGTAIGGVVGGTLGYIGGSEVGAKAGQRMVEFNQKSKEEQQAIISKNLGVEKANKVQAERQKKLSREQIIEQNKIRKNLGLPPMPVPAAPVAGPLAGTAVPAAPVAGPLAGTAVPAAPVAAPLAGSDTRGIVLQAESVENKEIMSPRMIPQVNIPPVISNNVMNNNTQSFVPIKPGPRVTATSFQRFQDRVAMG